MIPWKMWFSGIRDYDSTKMDLSGRQEHVLITGPNGAGKSTITYCMGAVLYSSKVDLEGLRSRNLLPDETWKAHIRLLFKNEGLLRIDAPDYVEFSLRIVQEPGQPVKREFAISSGDHPEQWENMTRYTSGDRQYNFTAYKKDLQYKYKLDPDLFYLIWYQQEVNQFAVMHPEERFRIFAEMHGIDQVQRNWEESMEKQKETQETLRVAESNVANKKQWMKIKKSELDRYEDNKRRLLEGGKLYACSLLQLEAHYKREQEQLTSHIEQLELEVEQQQECIFEMKGQEEEMQERLQALRQQIEESNAKLSQYDIQLQTLESSIRETKSAIAELDHELAEVNKEKERITRTEAEVKRQLADVLESLCETGEQHDKLQFDLQQSNEGSKDLMMAISRLEAAIEQERKQGAVHEERLRQYTSSHHVQEELQRLEQALLQAKERRHESALRRRDLQEELSRLDDERDWSRRQMDSLAYFRSNGMNAYALRELVELDESAQWKAEEQFDAIKYTLFFDGQMASPPNDLYHVPLRKVVPDRPVTELPALKLRVKAGLNEKVMPHAMKALWWVGQFFQDGATRIDQGVLIDPFGIRGPQEQRRYILSARALIERKNEVRRSLQELERQLTELDASIAQDTKRYQELNSIIQLVREAEAYRTSEHERASRARKLAEEEKRLEQLNAHIRERKQAQEELMRHQIQLEREERELQAEAEFYGRLGQLKEKVEALHAKRQQLASLKEQREQLRMKQELEENELEKRETVERKQERELQDLRYKQEQAERGLQRLRHQLQTRGDALDTAKGELVNTIREIEDLKQLARVIGNEAQVDLFSDEQKEAEMQTNQRLSLSDILTDLERGRVQFNQARNEENIDPAAPDNYKVVEEEFHRLQDEYKRTMILFEQNRERTYELKNSLETTINMRVLEIKQRFTGYMSRFQFEGEIDWEQVEDRRQRTHFFLYIKARKEGHRGTMEDVSVKARGGKVGKGVSGGEESLSSLLFALALLQNLETSPDFIVLDEFDSALDEQRKLKVFDLYASELERKLIILTPKSHESAYLDRFSKAYIVHHDPTVPRSKVAGIVKRDS
ncbi:AAA family ATPase [Paenibacillus thiaminolyticus]|uniref:Nuclease SbcCD subunit C n=1 Tax=Paenibacillus thiaminolyticus TaxID=49283 RepID=A0AAP9J1A8_PANTH|nr:AAA family ATPase [Paenibacillus thiaminolyticus]MCY9538726.1 AAA family ATPase [Paenibacillus thiaminolyticus]MCY9600401.1 AAA family ATPase [Paenibacillus thiaminolyticus]MCY9607269.1 AAA family ATPase [Paenibacillus thiaminolyticus]MCY9614460.1 AAA family ATPase [Paenibacillus thiaminolyticus]MCY9621510.1 AAA family ATPase [Paenibacillus thiaminolyticus]